MNTEVLQQQISEFMNSPVAVSVISISLGFIYLLVIFSKTSLGKKLFKSVLNKYDEIRKTAHESNEKVKNIQKLAEHEIAQLKSDYERKLAISVDYTDKLFSMLDEIVENIPNAKVKSTYKEAKEHLVEYREKLNVEFPSFEVIEELKLKAREVEVQVEEQVEVIKESYEIKLNELYDKYQELYEELKKLGVVEDEERIDTDTKEEEI